MCFENSNIIKENHDDYLCNDLNWSHSIEILLTDLLTYHIVYTFYLNYMLVRYLYSCFILDPMTFIFFIGIRNMI